MYGYQTCGVEAPPNFPNTDLVQETESYGHKYIPRFDPILQPDVTIAQKVSNNNGSEILSIEEPLASLEQLVDTSVDNLICILQKCRKNKNVACAKHVHTHIHSHGLEAHRVLGNYLVSMLVECERLPNAQQVFHKLAYSNEHCWTSLIQGYVDIGELEHALYLFQEMQEGCICPSKYTFLAVLKACARLKHVERGQEIHIQIIKEDLQADPFVGSALVDTYAKCGLLVEAREVFDQLLDRDVVTYTALIAGYADCGIGKEALNCLEEMQSEGFSPNTVTLVCSLKASCCIHDIESGQKLHAQIVKEALEDDSLIGNTLVNMYATYGMFSEVCDVFDELLYRDVVSWTVLIAGYANCGQGKDALHCLERMRVDGVGLNVVTFICSLKACGSIRAIERGRELHMEITVEGLEGDHYIGNSLVDMYASCGFLVDAEDAFAELQVQDVVSWNALISGYTEHGLCEEVLNCFEQMQGEDLSPNAITLVCSLKACGNLGALNRGQEMHIELTKQELEKDAFVGSVLIDMYAKCGLILEARDVFDELRVHDVVSWTALIAGYVEHGLVEEALTCFVKMKRDGVSPNSFTYTNILMAFGSQEAIRRGQALHLEIIKEGWETDLVLGNRLVAMYAKCGSLLEAWTLFDKLPVQDQVSWTALIAGYAEHELDGEALNCWQDIHLKGIPMNATILICILKSCGRMKNKAGGQEIHVEIAKEGFDDDLFVSNTLMDMYIKFGLLAEAGEVFDELPVRDAISWNTLIEGYIEHGFGEEAFGCLEKMEQEGVAPDAVTFICSLRACGSIGAKDRCLGLHVDIVKEGFDSDHFVGSSLVDVYAKCGSLAEAQEVFNELPVRDVVSWTALIAGYAGHSLGEDARNCFETMQLEGVPLNIATWNAVILGCTEQGEQEEAFMFYGQMQEQGLVPDSVTLVAILKVCGNIVALEIGKKVHAQVLGSHGLEAVDMIIVTALIDMYGKCASMLDAQKLFDEMHGRDTVKWTALVTAYARQGESDPVFQLLERMKDECIQPNGITFLSILTVCSHAGLLDQGLKYFKAMNKEYGIPTSIKHYNCLADMLSRAGQLAEAVTMLEEMPLQPNPVTWSTVLGACDVEMGRHTFECTVELPHHSSLLIRCQHMGECEEEDGDNESKP